MEIVFTYSLLIVPCYIKLMSKKVTKIYWIKARKVCVRNSNVSQLGLNSWIKLRQLERVQTLGKADFAEVTSPHTQGKHQKKRMILSYFFLILKSFSFVIWWPNFEASPHEQNIYWDFSKHQYFTGVKNIKQQNQGPKMLQKIIHFVYFCLPVCEVWLPKDYVFWLSSLYQRAAPHTLLLAVQLREGFLRGLFLSTQSLYQRAAPIPYSQLSLKLHPKIFLCKYAWTLDKLQKVLSTT